MPDAAAIFDIDAFSCSIPRTVLICASWLVTCALSSGLSGSWLRICATSSFRKRSSVPAAESVEAAVEDALEGALAPLAAAAEAAALEVSMVATRCILRHWPSCSVLASSCWVVFITSMLFWYERDAEIMFTISSMTLTLLCVT